MDVAAEDGLPVSFSDSTRYFFFDGGVYDIQEQPVKNRAGERVMRMGFRLHSVALCVPRQL